MTRVIENAVWLGVFMLLAATLVGVNGFFLILIERSAQL